MKKSLLLVLLLSVSVISNGQSIPENAFYAGLGGSYSLVNFSAVDANTLGLSNVYLNGNLLTSGYAGGPYVFPEGSDNSFTSSAQIGYYQYFKNSKWLWGAKYNYSYIGSSFMSSELHIPQVGAVGNTDFTGDAVVQSFEYGINSQMTLTPYIGVSVPKAFFYLGAGPSYSLTTENITGVVGYAFIGNAEVNISGPPTNFSSNNWVFGFAAVAGGTYFISPTLFMDISYTFDQTSNHTNDFFSSFTHTQGPVNTSGDLIGSTSSHVITNSFTLTINKIF